MGFLFHLIGGGLLSKLFGGLFGGGSECPTLLGKFFGHKWFRRVMRKKTEHACQRCVNGQVAYTPDGAPNPQWKTCEYCKGTGEDPQNPAPRPPDGLNRRQRKQWQIEHRPPVAPWAKSERFARVPTEMCARGCGAKNPTWRDTEAMRPKNETGPVWKLLGWAIGKVID